MGAGRQIDITLADNVVTVRDYGRGIPPKEVALGGRRADEHGRQVRRRRLQEDRRHERRGVKAVNMLSKSLRPVRSATVRPRTVTFAKGLEVSDRWESGVNEKNGTFISYRVDKEIFGEYAYNLEYVEQKNSLQLPEPGSDAQFQRQELRFEKRSAGPRERQHDRGAALSAHPLLTGRTSRW